MSDREHEQVDEASLARLLRAAGRGPIASAEARSRIYRAVHAEWRGNVASGADAAPSRGREHSWIAALNFWLLRGVPVAAALAVAVVALELSQNPAPIPGEPLASITKSVGEISVDGSPAATTVIRAGDTLSTGTSGSAALALDNGLILRVNAGSELLMAARDRIDVSRGTVYLDSGPAAGSAESLEIDTPFGSVWHVGTQYELRVGANNLRIRVREGTVGYRDSENSTLELRSNAGEQLLISDGGAAPVRTAVATSGPEWSWVENLATVPTADEYRLIDLLDWVARETGRELRFTDETLESTAQADMLFGVAGLTPTETLDVIASTTTLRYEMTDGDLLIF